MTMIGPWREFVPSPSNPWDLPKVAHLHRRAGFWANRSELARDAQAGPAASVDRFFDPPPPSDDERRIVESLREGALSNAERLKAWWLYQILFGADPLGEKMTLFWHGHFATSNQKVDSLPLMCRQNQLLRRHALGGGNDGLNTIIPYADENYRRARPTLALSPERVRKIDAHIGLHSSLGGFEKLLERGQLSVIQSVGYPNPNRSHFESMAIWQSGKLHARQGEMGWLARAADRSQAAAGADPAALHVRESASLPQALSGGELAVLSLTGPEQFRRRVGSAGTTESPAQRAREHQLARQAGESRGGLVDFVQRTAAVTDAASARFARLDELSGASQQAGLMGRMILIAQLIKAGLATRIYYTELAGFDTHASQWGTHPRLLRELGDAVEAFISDLSAAGEAERVLVLVYSEFGRRLSENASGGTDHGTVQPVFLAGGAIRRPFIGSSPDLNDLDASGDPKYSIDFRRIYATLLDDWLACPSAIVVGEKIEPLPLL